MTYHKDHSLSSRMRHVQSSDIAERFLSVRALTDVLTAPLSAEDQVPQSMPMASPVAWHRAHTSWFFEEVVLNDVRDWSRRFLFNSYYDVIGDRQPRSQRGQVTRPSVQEICDYRAEIDDRITDAINRGAMSSRALGLLEMGCNHEQQHQELLLMDLKHLLSMNPIEPKYLRTATEGSEPAAASTFHWQHFDECVTEIGFSHNDSEHHFSYDNERNRHKVYLHPFDIADRQVTAGEWKDFIADGGYARPELWLSDGWEKIQQEQWQAPLYWRRGRDGQWTTFTLAGRTVVNDCEPVCHISYYEAQAFATWSQARLPTEAEWEHASRNWSYHDELHPSRCHPRDVVPETIGGVWEWTQSAYLPYPGFVPETGIAAEYNGKFMSDQFVLRGASALTPAGHSRRTYRNFFPARARWMCGGVRLAR